MEKKKLTAHNIVRTGTLGLNSNLEKLIFALDGSNASYEPEQLPCLMYKNFDASFLLFPSGKLIVAGVKDAHAGEEAAEKFRQIDQFTQMIPKSRIGSSLCTL